MQLAATRVRGHPYVAQSIVGLYLICNVVELCLGISNTLEIWNVSVLEICKMYAR
jgi:hypothetical protein